MYSPENYGNTVRILAAMAEYINHIEDSFDLDNVMALELLNEPWAHLVSAANLGILHQRTQLYFLLREKAKLKPFSAAMAGFAAEAVAGDCPCVCPDV